MSDNTNPVAPAEPASALSAAPTPPTASRPGLWARLSMIQKLSAVVSGGVVTVVGGYAGYNKLTTKPAAAHAEPKVVLAKPDESKPEPVKKEPTPEAVPTLSFDELPPVPKPPTVTVTPPRAKDNDDVPLIAPPPVIISDKPKPMSSDIVIPEIAPPKELPATMQNKKDKDVPIIRVGGAEDTAPPPKKIDTSVPKLDLDLPPIPAPIKAAGNDQPPLIAPPKVESKDPQLIAPPKVESKDPPLIAPPKVESKDPPLIAPPKVESKDPPLIAPPKPEVTDPPLISPPKKDDPPLISPPTITLPKDMTMPPPRMIEIPPPETTPPTITVPPRKDTMPPTIEPMPPAPMTPKKDNYEEDWHTKKPGDTYALVSREYYHSAEYASALEAYNKEHSKAGDRIIRVPPLWVLEEKFPNLLGKPEKIEKPVVDPKTPGLKFEPVETPPVIGGSPRPAPPPAVAPVGATNDEYRVSNPQGESIREIARKIFGSPDAWKRLWEMNQSLDPTQPIPTGTTLRIR